MGLTGSLMIGRSALLASQVALQMTGNNIANAATPGYHRQRISMLPVQGSNVGTNVFVGRGVGVQEIARVVNPALQARVQASLSDEAGAGVEAQVLTTLETITNELTGIDLSSGLSAFFNSFSELANNPGGSAVRSAVVEQGASLAAQVRSLRGDLLRTREQIEDQLRANVERADELVDAIAGLNRAVVNAEQGRGEEGNLRDQRDRLVSELAGLMDITTVEQSNGAVDIHIDSQPVVLGSVSRGLRVEVRSDPSTDVLEFSVQTRVDPERLRPRTGTIGALLEQREVAVQGTLDSLSEVASQLIFQVNRLHSGGRPGTGGWTELTSDVRLPLADRTVSFNDPANATLSGMPFGATNGSFRVVMRDQNGNTAESTISVNLDGLTNAGASGFGDDTTPADIVAALDLIPNLNATITTEGRIRITTDAGYEVSFAEDTSGVLATLGIAGFFSGTTANDIGVRSELQADPSLLAAGYESGTNEVALSIAGLRDAGLGELNGRSLNDLWQESVERNAVQTRAAQTRLEALSSVRQSLEAQEAALSGVSLDEESINLIAYQQQYQGAARFISVTNELTAVLLGLV